MHRITSIPGNHSADEVILVEQPGAPVLFLTSASTDIATASALLALKKNAQFRGLIRAIQLSALFHPAQIDHYLSTTANNTEIIVLRLLGGRSHWSYGIEKLISWQKQKPNRQVIILSGVQENYDELHEITNINRDLSDQLADFLNIGGIANFQSFLDIIYKILKKKQLDLSCYNNEVIEDPHQWDWLEEKGDKVGILLYRSQYQSGDLRFAKSLNQIFRKNGLSPRVLFISSLKNPLVNNQVFKIFTKEAVKLIVTGTSFSSVDIQDCVDGISLWEKLNTPVLQMMLSSQSKQNWIKSSVGLNPIDLSIQIVLPEIDGRIITRPCGFKETVNEDTYLCTKVERLVPEIESINWISSYIKNWIKLQNLHSKSKKITIVIANYPIKNGRLANGVGLDTPSSLLNILEILKNSGHDLGQANLPTTSRQLMKLILSYRTNDCESINKTPLTYLSLRDYEQLLNEIAPEAITKIIDKWGEPSRAIELEKEGFAIHGIRFGNITILIQPSRGYDYNDLKDLHSPNLIPPHRYIAQYLWIKNIESSNLIIHLGKHGSVEWLPGKAVGVSQDCYSSICINDIPHIYPFIVNDPGEGSQAKRRTQAVIIDHMTPPVAKSGLHGELLQIESLMDEYYESMLISPTRTKYIEETILKLLSQSNWPDIKKFEDGNSSSSNLFNEVESYLCEIKQNQIRTGLHVFGQNQETDKLIELLLSISIVPTQNHQGLTQWISEKLNLSVNPILEEFTNSISANDLSTLSTYSDLKYNNVSDVIEWLEEQARYILEYLLDKSSYNKEIKLSTGKLCKPIQAKLDDPYDDYINNYLLNNLIPRVINCGNFEKVSILNAINGIRVPSGPSGAPTRGRVEVLPTGRNFYSVDLRGLPTEIAWDLGKRSAENLLELHLMEEGENLRHLAMSVWGTSTMRNGGEDIAQLLALIGVKPIWDGISRRVIDFEIIPLSVLGRPRVDVLLRISGLFRDAFPQLVSFVHRAQKAIASLDEPSEFNPLATLYKSGQCTSRIFGSAAGSYGVGLQELINSGSWNSQLDLSEEYLCNSKWVYDGENEPISDLKGLKNSLKLTTTVLHNQDNKEHDILDSDDYYQFHGGLACSVEKLSGNKPKILIGDNSNYLKPKVHNLSKEIDKVMRSRVLNPKWLEGIKSHGYKGAFEMSATMDYLFSYDATTNQVPNWCYSSICQNWLNNKSILNFLKTENPWAIREISERLLEAHNRGMWSDASSSQLNYIKALIYETEAYIEKEEFTKSV